MKDNESEKKKMIIPTIWIAVFWVVIAGLAGVGVTAAWFTFNPATNVEPIGSTISDGETTLYVGLSPDGPFETSVPMPKSAVGDLEPMSTVNLVDFYASVMHNRNGVAIKYKDVTDEAYDNMITGTLYLKSLKGNCGIYFYRPGMVVEADAQTLASLRLGIRLTTEGGEHTYIFTLDEFGNTSVAESKTTVPEKEKVVAGINGDGSAVYVQDPSQSVASFFAVLPEGNERNPSAGEKSLGTLQENEVARVDYWLYLEGCDENCLNSVQEKDTSLALSFAGVTMD